MGIRCRDEPERGRYAMYDGDELLSVVDYRVSGDAVSFPHTHTVPKHRGHGHAERLVAYAVEQIETTTDLRIVPMCWFVAKWFDEHPEHAALLVR